MSEEKTKDARAQGLGKTLDIYRNIAVAINSFPREKKISVKDLAEKANVHWNTAKKALVFFSRISPLVPRFELMENHRFEVKEKPSAMDAAEGIFESQQMRILTKMMLAEVTESEKARKLDKVLTTEERSFLADLIEKGYVNSINGSYYLSKRGQSIGSMGLRKIVELNVPLPWDVEARSTGRKMRQPPRLQKPRRYASPSRNLPKPIYKQQPRLPRESKWKSYIS